MALEGELCLLREVRESDLEVFVRLRNDLATQAWSRTLPPDYTIDMMRSRYLERSFDYKRSDGIFVIEATDDGSAVGTISYTGVIDRMEAVWGIALDRDRWGTGIAREATDLLLRFMFLELGLKVIRLYTQTENERAVAAFRTVGFVEAARLPLSIYKAGRMAENLVMDMLREEWFERHPELTDTLVDPFR